MRIRYWVGGTMLATGLLVTVLPILLFSRPGSFEGWFLEEHDQEDFWAYMCGNTGYSVDRISEDGLTVFHFREDGSVRGFRMPWRTRTRSPDRWEVEFAFEADVPFDVPRSGSFFWDTNETVRFEVEDASGGSHGMRMPKVHNPLVLWYLQCRYWFVDEGAIYPAKQ